MKSERLARTWRTLTLLSAVIVAVLAGCRSAHFRNADLDEPTPEELGDVSTPTPQRWKAPVVQPVPRPESIAQPPEPEAEPEAERKPWWRRSRKTRGDDGTDGGDDAGRRAARQPEAETNHTPAAAGTAAATNTAAEGEDDGFKGRRLRRGDEVTITLRGLPQDQQIQDVVDQRGNVKLPFIGEIGVAGKTPAEVEAIIERKYVDGGIYKHVYASVLPPSSSYFMRGEIQRPGRYPLTRDVTFVQAIAIAGGYTEYADSTRVQVIRGAKNFYINAKARERGKEKDEFIEPDDVIVVKRTWW
ncbi:MAG: polysaccharide export protein [Kiritimatiellae bacterium]|nr:polysaccharide export protein [Kiritimatiellia bacterium]